MLELVNAIELPLEDDGDVEEEVIVVEMLDNMAAIVGEAS